MAGAEAYAVIGSFCWLGFCFWCAKELHVANTLMHKPQATGCASPTIIESASSGDYKLERNS